MLANKKPGLLWAVKSWAASLLLRFAIFVCADRCIALVLDSLYGKLLKDNLQYSYLQLAGGHTVLLVTRLDYIGTYADEDGPDGPSVHNTNPHLTVH